MRLRSGFCSMAMAALAFLFCVQTASAETYAHVPQGHGDGGRGYHGGGYNEDYNGGEYGHRRHWCSLEEVRVRVGQNFVGVGGGLNLGQYLRGQRVVSVSVRMSSALGFGAATLFENGYAVQTISNIPQQPALFPLMSGQRQYLNPESLELRFMGNIFVKGIRATVEDCGHGGRRPPRHHPQPPHYPQPPNYPRPGYDHYR